MSLGMSISVFENLGTICLLEPDKGLSLIWTSWGVIWGLYILRSVWGPESHSRRFLGVLWELGVHFSDM